MKELLNYAKANKDVMGLPGVYKTFWRIARQNNCLAYASYIMDAIQNGVI